MNLSENLLEHSVPHAGTLNQISYCRRCGAAFYKCKKGPCVMSTERLVASALAVMILDPKIKAFLEANDPKALEQAQRAVKAAEQDPEFDFVIHDPGVRAKLGL